MVPAESPERRVTLGVVPSLILRGDYPFGLSTLGTAGNRKGGVLPDIAPRQSPV